MNNIVLSFRKKHSLTQKRMAELLGCTARTIVGWEKDANDKDHRNPPPYLVRALNDIERELAGKRV